jgi:hypothetical protein
VAEFGAAIAAVSKLIDTLGPEATGTSPLLRPAKRARLSPNFIEVQKKPEEKRTDTEEKYINKLQEKIISGAVEGYLKHRTGLEKFKLAVVELTDNPNKPFYVGFHDQEEVPVWSVAKLLVMYAAYQLRHDLREVAAQSHTTTQADLITEAKAQWVRAPEPIVKKIVLTDPDPRFAKAGPPNMQKIFDMVRNGGSWKIDFKRSGETPVDLEKVDRKTTKSTPESLAIIDSLEFLERMWLMIGWSNDLAAATCVRDVGYPYMTALTSQSGLYNPITGGLWLGGDYQDGAVAGPWKPSPVGGIVPAGTAKALATFMTVLAQDRLVDATASADMRDLMEFPKTITNLRKDFGDEDVFSPSYFVSGLPKPPNGQPRYANIKALHRKIGLILGATQHEVALVELNEALPRRYVLVALQAKHTQGEQSLLRVVAETIDYRLQSWFSTR